MNTAPIMTSDKVDETGGPNACQENEIRIIVQGQPGWCYRNLNTGRIRKPADTCVAPLPDADSVQVG